MGALFPPRKDLEFIPLKHDGQTCILVQDRFGLVAEGTAISPALYQFLVLLDRADDERDLQRRLMAQSGGSWISLEQIQKILTDLDRGYLLDSESSARAKQSLMEEFVRMSSRPACFAGKVYPAEAGELSSALQEILAEAAEEDTASAEDAVALIAPHIDLAVGRRAYAQAYSLLPDMHPERVIVLGVGHAMDQGMFSVSCKDYETPLGSVPADRLAAAKVQSAGAACQTPNDFVHRFEHSIEFQCLFLQQLLPEGSFSMVPVLCGSLAGLADSSRQAFLDQSGAFLDSLRELLEDPACPTRLIAGVDFSHIGPKFGHSQDFKTLKPRAEEHDRRLLQALCCLDAEAFWSELRRTQARFNVCGSSAMACLLELLPSCRGHVLEHAFWEEQATSSGVSYAAAVFRKA